jgi:hypothetical protein
MGKRQFRSYKVTRTLKMNNLVVLLNIHRINKNLIKNISKEIKYFIYEIKKNKQTIINAYIIIMV